MSYSGCIEKHRKGIIFFMLLLTVVCVFLIPLVQVNYNIIDYLPDNAGSTKALDIMGEQYPDGIPTDRIMVNNISLADAQELKNKIAAVNGVNDVIWLDDEVNLATPIAYLDKDTVERYYKDTSAIYTVTFDEVAGLDALREVQKIVGDDAAFSGITTNMVVANDNLANDLTLILLIAVPIILLLLFLTTNSWIEPVLLLITLGIAVIINMGTNILFGEISYLSSGIAAALQLAVSMDYAIFLIHRFGEYSAANHSASESMHLTLKTVASSILMSGITTMIGFASLLAMHVKLGPDIGCVMVKGVIVSLICVFTFLPAASLCCRKLIRKTHHRPFIPSLKKSSNVIRRCSVPCLIIFLILLVPAVLAVENTDYKYMNVYTDPNTQIGQDAQKISEKFGDASTLVLMVEKEGPARETALLKDIEALPHITSVISYSKTVSSAIPQGYLPEETLEQLVSKDYSRYVISVGASRESAEGLAAVEQLRNLAETYYPGQWELTGDAAECYDMKMSVLEDDVVLSIIAVGGIFLVLLLMFKSLIVPLLLLFVIEAAIWINCGVPYFAGADMCYISRMIVFSIQLGATVDYAILFSTRYFAYRKTEAKRKAFESTISTALPSILTSAAVMFTCFIFLGVLSHDSVISEVGILLARGVVLSLISVVFVLPALLMLFDKPIQKLSLKMKFVSEDSEVINS